MKQAIFDNPATFRREWWCDGELVGFITFNLLMTRPVKFPDNMTAGAKAPVKEGYIDGDIDAIAESSRPVISTDTTAQLEGEKTQYVAGDRYRAREEND